MVPKFIILINIFILLASVALAVSSSSRLEARLTRRRENRQSNPINLVDTHDGANFNTMYSSNWAGVVLSESKGNFTNVTGIFTVPTPTGADGSASAWVGIDGDTCGTAILQTGVDFTISGGKASYDCWFEWFPDYAYDFDNFIVSAGDEIRLIVIASSATSGMVVIENLSTGLVVIEKISSSYPLCQQDAEWIVEDYKKGGKLVPFVNFGTVTFTSATVSRSGNGSSTPNGGTSLNIRQNGVVLTSSSINGSTVTISHV